MSRGKGKASMLGQQADTDADRLLAYQFGDLYDKHPKECRVAIRVFEAFALTGDEPPVSEEQTYKAGRAETLTWISFELLKFVTDAMYASEERIKAAQKRKRLNGGKKQIQPLRALVACIERALEPPDPLRSALTLIAHMPIQPKFPIVVKDKAKAASSLQQIISTAIKVVEKTHHNGDVDAIERQLDAWRLLHVEYWTFKDALADGLIAPKDLGKLLEGTSMECSDRKLRQTLSDCGYDWPAKGSKGGRPKKQPANSAI